MALDINNADFKIFTDFAATAKQGTRAQLESKIELGGEVRTIKSAGGLDFVGNVGRLSKHKDANNAVRNIFRETVARMFGGEGHIPESVLKVMKLEDYGKGKPLTARRITEVKNAIEAFANEAKASADQAIEKLFRSRAFFKEMPQNESDELKRIVSDIFETCDSAMAREVMGENIVAICLRGDDVIRSEEDIKSKADAIKANCREIQTAAKGNQQILNAGKFMMIALAGKSLPPGQIGKLTAFATGKAAKMDVIRRLKSSTGPVTITKAVIQFVKTALDVAGIKLGAFETEIANPTMEFAKRVMLQRLGPSKLRNVQQALTGENASQLDFIAKTIGMYGLSILPIPEADLQEAIMDDPAEEIPKELRDEIRDKFNYLVTQKMPLMSAIVGEILNENPPEVTEGNEGPDNILLVLREVKNFVVENPNFKL